MDFDSVNQSYSYAPTQQQVLDLKPTTHHNILVEKPKKKIKLIRKIPVKSGEQAKSGLVDMVN